MLFVVSGKVGPFDFTEVGRLWQPKLVFQTKQDFVARFEFTLGAIEDVFDPQAGVGGEVDRWDAQ